MNTTNSLDIYYQHISPGDQDYKKVTKLLYIDDTDPSMILYHFADGTKCNALFVAPVNTEESNISKYYMVQLNDKKSVWKIDKVETKAEYRTLVNQEGQTFTMPMLDKDNKPILDKVRYDYTAPARWGSLEEKNTDLYKIRNLIEMLKQDYEFKDDELAIVHNIPSDYFPQHSQVIYSDNNEEATVKDDANNSVIPVKEADDKLPDIDDVLRDTCVIINDKKYSSLNEIIQDLGNNIELTLRMEIDNVKDSILKEYDEKIKNIQASSVTIANPLYDELKSSVNENMCNVVEQMIENAHSDTAIATIEVSLPLPPKELYNLLKTAYSLEWSDAFIKLLASHVDIKDLQYSLSAGLHTYYDSGDKKE